MNKIRIKEKTNEIIIVYNNNVVMLSLNYLHMKENKIKYLSELFLIYGFYIKCISCIIRPSQRKHVASMSILLLIKLIQVIVHQYILPIQKCG